MLDKETIRTRIWHEQAEADNPFAAAVCLCHGYDVYGDLLGKASWLEYLYLLFHGERPDQSQCQLLNDLAIVLANPGPRDHSVLAAMNGGVGGSNNAACLMAALAVGGGQLGGAHEVALGISIWNICGTNLELWRQYINKTGNFYQDDWPDIGHIPGFDPHGSSCTTPVRQTLDRLSSVSSGQSLPWLRDNRALLEDITQSPLTMSGIASSALHDLRFSASQGEMLFLILRLPGAAVHAIEQAESGYRHFPFYRNAVVLKDVTAK
jgi:citrate synthase